MARTIKPFLKALFVLRCTEYGNHKYNTRAQSKPTILSESQHVRSTEPKKGVLRRGPRADGIAPGGGAPRWRPAAGLSTLPCKPPTLIAAISKEGGPMHREDAKVSLTLSKVSF